MSTRRTNRQRSEDSTSPQAVLRQTVAMLNFRDVDLPGQGILLATLPAAANSCISDMTAAVRSISEVHDLFSLQAAGKSMTQYTLSVKQLDEIIDTVIVAAEERSAPESVYQSVLGLRSIVERDLRPPGKAAAEKWLELYAQHRYGLPITRDDARGESVSDWNSIADLCQASIDLEKALNKEALDAVLTQASRWDGVEIGPGVRPRPPEHVIAKAFNSLQEEEARFFTVVEMTQ